MQRQDWKKCGVWLAGLAVALVAFRTAGAFEPPVGPMLPMPTQMPLVGEPVRLSEYWIGLECRPASEALRAQLGLPEDQGLVVGAVVPDSPAQKAGFKAHDVLVTANDKPLRTIQDLIDAVDAAKDKPLTIELLRGGKRQSIEVTPTKRPEPSLPDPEAPATDWERQMRKWAERMQPGEGRWPFRLRFFGPGVILPPDAEPAPAMPENLTVTITKQGQKPARIVVTRGDEKWEVTEDELDKLPEDVRPHVERILGREGEEIGGRLRFFDFVPEWYSDDADPDAESEAAEPLEGRLEKRLQTLERRLEEMRKSLNEALEDRPRLRRFEQPKAAPDAEDQI